MGRARLAQLMLALCWPMLAASLTACGQPLRVGSARTLRVALQEYRVDPEDVQASPGRLTIVAHNQGRLTHNLVISQGGRWRGVVRPLGPGQSGRVTVTLPPGQYQMTSTILSDHALGVYGTLTVAR